MDFLTFISEQWLLVSVLVLLIYAFAFSERARSGKPLSPQEVTRLINREEGVVVDLRDTKAYGDGHIAGALHIPHTSFASRETELEKHKDKTIVLADKMGQHAGSIGKKLKQQGYDARRLRGGMAEWVHQGLPLVREKGGKK